MLLPDQALAWALQGLSACLTADLGKVILYRRVLCACEFKLARPFVATSCQPIGSTHACKRAMGAYRLLTHALPALCESPPLLKAALYDPLGSAGLVQ